MSWFASIRPRGSLFLLALVLLGFTGCGSGDTRPRFIILSNNPSPYWDAMRVGMNKAAQDFNVRAVMENCNGTEDDQLAKLRQFGSQTGVAAIAISAIVADNAAIVDQMKQLQQQGVKVITIDSDVNRERFRDARTAFLGTNNFEAGEELGKAAQGLVPEGANYVSFVGRLGAQNAKERIAGFAKGAGEKFSAADAMADEADHIRARENVRNAMNRPEVDMLVGIWSYNAPAIVDVVQERNVREKYRVVVFDAEPRAIDQMVAGQIDVMLVQNPYDMGYQSIKLMQALVKDDQATVRAMLPKLGEPDGELYITGLKVVVPNEQSPLRAEMFGPHVEFMPLAPFRAWLQQNNLKGS